MRKYICSFFLVIFILSLPQSSECEEKKSFPFVLGTALSPIAIISLGCIIDPMDSLAEFAPLVITSSPIVSHGYLEDYKSGLKFFLIKGAGAFIMLDSLYRDFDSLDDDIGDVLLAIEFSLGSIVLLGTYFYEIGYLVKKTKKINASADKEISISFYPVVDTDRISLGVTLNF